MARKPQAKTTPRVTAFDEYQNLRQNVGEYTLPQDTAPDTATLFARHHETPPSDPNERWTFLTFSRFIGTWGLAHRAAVEMSRWMWGEFVGDRELNPFARLVMSNAFPPPEPNQSYPRLWLTEVHSRIVDVEGACKSSHRSGRTLHLRAA